MTKKVYPYWFLLPIGIIFTVIFIIPTAMSFFYAFTWWNLVEWRFIGFDNFITFFSERRLRIGITNTMIYAVFTSGGKVVLGLFLGAFLCSRLKTVAFLRSMIFFPTLLSTMAVGISFFSLMHPTRGIINTFLAMFGVAGPDWLGNASFALWSVIFVDIWRGVGLATVIYIAGIMSIDRQYYEALEIDGGGTWHQFRFITVPLSRPAMHSVIVLSFIGGLRTFDLVWVMTGGGPGFASELMTSIIFKNFASGFHGLATAGNVILFIMVSVLVFPLFWWLNRKEVD